MFLYFIRNIPKLVIFFLGGGVFKGKKKGFKDFLLCLTVFQKLRKCMTGHEKPEIQTGAVNEKI